MTAFDRYQSVKVVSVLAFAAYIFSNGFITLTMALGRANMLNLL